ncbi:shootin-1-like [Pyrgilauda ruficollis]|uniref:shootin-1-like n=1 Tax=Pyrgilauda ruficollis TaxID=221976 RepID=UPI001B87BAF6|nr:shootin-1-like [Pyrgilauda ruficollis]
MARAGDGVGGHLTAILESGSSEEEEEEDEEAAPAQHPPLDPVPDDTESRLAELEQASQALLAELAALDTEVELEQQCWQRAQAFSAQENAQLERLSLARSPKGTPEVTPEEVTPVMTPEVAPEEVTHTEVPPEEPPTHTQLPAPQEDLSQLLEHHRDLQAQLQHLHTQLELEREEQQRLRAALAASQRALRSFKRVSQIVTQDYCQALEQLELEQDLRCHAEAFAHQMLVQQKEAKRQSSILLRSAAPNSQILEALQELEKLSRELEETRQERRQREQELEQQREELQRAREALEEEREEKRELRERLEGLEKEVGSLWEQLAQPPQSHPEVPPPPPLPPPAATAIPADPLATLRQRKARKSREQSDSGTEDIHARAVQEMLERIRTGIVLRPARARPSPCQEQELEQQREELQRAREALEEEREEKRELRERLEGLEKEVGSLWEQLAQPPQSHPEVPPPPPLPPPAATAIPAEGGDRVTDLSPPVPSGVTSCPPRSPLATLRQRKARKSREQSDSGTEDIHARAVQEMLERIRTGIVLRPARARPSPCQDSMTSKRRSAALELQGILGALRRPSRRRSRKSRDQQLGSVLELGSILERRRRALDASMGDSVGNSMGNNSMGNQSMGNNSMGNSMGINSFGTNSMRSSMGTNSMGTNSMGTNSMGTNSMGTNSMGTNSMGTNSMGTNSMGTNSMSTNSMGTSSTGTNSMRNSTGAQERDGAGKEPDAGNRNKDQEQDTDKDKDTDTASVPFRPRGLGGLPRTRPRPRWAWDSGDNA